MPAVRRACSEAPRRSRSRVLGSLACVHRACLPTRRVSRPAMQPKAPTAPPPGSDNSLQTMTVLDSWYTAGRGDRAFWPLSSFVWAGQASRMQQRYDT
eukprot:6180658-Pleurochrysis_carterae.AAC.3